MRALCGVLLALLLWLPALGAAQSPDEAFENGKLAYQKGAYARSAEHFRRAEKMGLKSAALYYNLGNAYYELEDWGRARASYEKARLLIPRSKNLQHNLALLAAQLSGEDHSESSWAKLARLFTLNELAGTTALFYWVAAALVVAWSRRRHEWMLWTAASLACLALFVAVLLGWRLLTPARAAVIAPRVVVKNGPGREFTDSLTLTAGKLVTVEEERGDWRRVVAIGRVPGWLRAEQLQQIEE